MPRPNIYQYFNAQWDLIGQVEGQVRFSHPPSEVEGANEALLALFLMAESVHRGDYPIAYARNLAKIRINRKGPTFTIPALATHTKGGGYQVGEPVDYRNLLRYENPPRDAMAVIAAVFPEFSFEA